MFDSSYPFIAVHNRKAYPNEFFLIKRLFRFKGKGSHTYIVEVEEYTGNLFVVKFYLKSHRLSPDKFSLLTDKHDMQGIVRTCINIMLDFYRKHPDASFAFIGQQGKDETNNTTQRFRIYRAVMQNFFSSPRFIHYQIPAVSAYLLLNWTSSLSLQEVEKLFLPFFPINPGNLETC